MWPAWARSRSLLSWSSRLFFSSWRLVSSIARVSRVISAGVIAPIPVPFHASQDVFLLSVFPDAVDFVIAGEVALQAVGLIPNVGRPLRVGLVVVVHGYIVAQHESGKVTLSNFL